MLRIIIDTKKKQAMASSEFKKMDKFRKKVFVSSGRLESAFIAVVEACQTRMALGISVNYGFPQMQQ